MGEGPYLRKTAAPMSHIFISYSRRDLEYADAIVKALGEQGLETWIDWKSIPKGEDWEQEIHVGIEGSDAFLLLVSPHSIKSPICNREIVHAIRNNKRILPVIIGDADTSGFQDAAARAEIERLNWIFCRRGQDDFAPAIETIRETIRTDYDWLRFHTALQMRALAWERARMDPSRLLRGKELQEAQARIAAVGATTDPGLTRLQEKYLDRSSRALGRQRRRPFVLLVATFTALGLLVTWMYASWYSIVPIRRACPGTTQVEVRLDAGRLPPEQRQALETARDQSPTRTALTYCDETAPEYHGVLVVNAVPEPSGNGIELEILLPERPAYRLDFLPEIRRVGPEVVPIPEAAKLIRSAASYSLGDYESAASVLQQIANERSGQAGQELSRTSLILLAQSQLFLDKFEDSRKTYELALAVSEPQGEPTSRLHMGAALAHWRPLLYDSSNPQRSQLCRMAQEHYQHAEPWPGAEPYLRNVRIIYADEFRCDDTAWKGLSGQSAGMDEDANAIAHFIRAEACTVDGAVPGCDYLGSLGRAEARILFARALLIRHYFQRIDSPDHCDVAEPYLERFRNEIFSPLDVSELRALLRLQALNCS